MNEDIEVLKQYVEALGLHNKTVLAMGDLVDLRSMLREADELGLADYVEGLAHPNELQDLITNVLYGDA